MKTRRTGNVPFGQAAAMDRHAIGLKVEQKGDDFRVSFEEPRNVEAPQREHGPIHPVLTTDPKQVEFDQLNQFLKGL